jgi:uncharacterized protein YbjT (DUF2867 family)
LAISTTDKGLVTVFGASGFIGRHVVRALSKRGWRIRAAVRRPDLAGHLQPLGMPMWIHPVQANLRYRWSVDRAVADSDVVVNLVGILNQGGRQTFDAVHAFGARAVAEAARAAGHSRIVHISALGADADAPSAYGRSKAAGEDAVRETLPDSTIVRPSLVFGQEDRFFNRFASLARAFPVVPVVGGGQTRFQPVFVGDLARVIADAVDGVTTPGATYEIGGPEIRTLRQCMEIMLEQTGRNRPLVNVPWSLVTGGARVLQLLPNPLVTVDQIRQLRVDNVVSEEAAAGGRTLAGLGIHPTTMAAVLPTYLYRFRPQGQFDAQRITDR